jgi:hypothetical protein
LIELLIASAVMAMTMAALAALGKAVQVNAAYGDGHGQAVQHARVAIERITRMAREATASPSFPGFLVLTEAEAGWRFPDTVVIWHPSGSPVDPNGLPRFNELIIYCPDPEDPHQLVEITAPSDTRTVPALSDLTTWASRIDGIKNASSSQMVMLTDLMRSCPVGTGFRGAVRFESRLRPSAEEWTSYQAGDLDWDDLPWVQGLYGSKTGLRQAWLRIELQLMPGATVIGDDPGGQQAMAFLGSAALYFQMRK